MRLISSSSKLKRFGNLVCLVLLSAFVLAAIGVMVPEMPSTGLDPSWKHGINWAAAHGLVFGHEMVFTFGPYGALYSKTYYPDLDTLLVLCSIFLAVSIIYLLCVLTQNLRGRGLFLIALMVLSNAYRGDALLFAYPFLLCAVVLRICLPAAHSGHLKLTPREFFWLVASTAGLGLLPLIKGSYLVMVLLMAGFSAALLWWHGFKKIALGIVLLPVFAGVFFWCLIGQPLAALPDYFVAMKEIIAGYSDAVSKDGETWVILTYIAVSAVLLSVAVLQKKLSWAQRLFVLLVLSLFLLTGFKAGMVRYDAGHVANSLATLMAAALIMSFVLRSPSMLAALLLCVVAWAALDHVRPVQFAKQNFYAARVLFADAGRAARQRIKSPERLPKQYAEHMVQIAAASSIPKVSGTTDTYSFNQTDLLASGNAWSPRPVLQSYSVYTDDLITRNRQHVESPRAAQNVFFQVQAIDDNLPALEDGNSWTALRERYQVKNFNQHLHLQKRATPVLGQTQTLWNRRYKIGERVVLPENIDLTLAQFDVQSTLLGKLANAFFRPNQLLISLELASGNQVTYRLVPSMARLAFPLSPLVESTPDFAAWLTDASVLQRKQVRAFTLHHKDTDFGLWQTEYGLKLSHYQSTNHATLPFKLTQMSSQQHSKIDEFECEGGIENINRHLPDTPNLKADGVLAISGWTAYKAQGFAAADEIQFLLKQGDNQRLIAQAERQMRPDVKSYLGLNFVPQAGYAAYVDVRNLRGDWQAQLLRKKNQTWQACSNAKFKISMGNR